MFSCETDYHLRPLLDTLSPNEHIIAQDVTTQQGGVCKRYIKGTVERLKQLWKTKPAWVSPHWYEICLERPSRLFMDVESTASAERVRKGLDAILKYVRYKLGVECDVISSCSAEKQSYHILAPVFFKNVYHVGAWVRMCWQYMHVRLALKEESHAGISLDEVRAVMEPECIIDTLVYNRNRAFRLCGSSKLGSDRVLTHPSKHWFDLMVQPALPPGVVPLEQLEYDGAEPVSTSLSAGRMFRFTGTDWVRTGMHSSRSGAHDCKTQNPFPPLLEPVIEYLEEHWDLERSSAVFNAEYGTWRVGTRCRHCLIADREHRGNHVWLILSPNGLIVQRCHDGECGRQFANIDVPEECWAPWKESWVTPISLRI